MVNDIYNKLKTVQSVVKEFGKQVLKEENVAKGFLGPNKEEHFILFPQTVEYWKHSEEKIYEVT